MFVISKAPSFGILAVLKCTQQDFPDYLMWDCVETVCVSGSLEVNLFNLWTLTGGGNFLRLYIWGGSGSAGGASCPLQSGGRLLCGYNMVGQVYCLERGCALVLSQLRAGTHCVWRTKTLTGWTKRVRVEHAALALSWGLERRCYVQRRMRN